MYITLKVCSMSAVDKFTRSFTMSEILNVLAKLAEILIYGNFKNKLILYF